MLTFYNKSPEQRIRAFLCGANSVPNEALQYAPPNFFCNNQDNHKLLTSLLHHSNKQYLGMYKITERLLASVKSSTPKIILYLYSPAPNAAKGFLRNNERVQSSHRMFAKVMLIENGPSADIEAAFVEGTSFQLRNRDQEVCQMTVRRQHQSTHGESIFYIQAESIFSSNLQELLSASRHKDLMEMRTIIQKLSKHFCMVQSASKECIFIDEKITSETTPRKVSYPISVNMTASTSDRSQWSLLE